MIAMNIIQNNILNLVAYHEDGTKVRLQITPDMDAQQIMDGLAVWFEQGYIMTVDK